MYFKNDRLVVSIFMAFTLCACSTIAPERTAASQLMGKNIQEAYKIFGTPWLTGTETSVSPESKYYGQNFYIFGKTGISYNRNKLVGSYMDTSEGHPVHVDQYQTEHVQEACNIAFWADKKTNIIDYYEVKGNCGWGGMGFGTTGAFHSWGIN